LKLVGLVSAVFLGGGAVLTVEGINQRAALTTAVLAMIFFYLPDTVVGFLARKRKQAVFLGLPEPWTSWSSASRRDSDSTTPCGRSATR